MTNVNVMKLLKTIQKTVGVSIKKASENLKLPRKKQTNMMMHFILHKVDNLVSKTQRLKDGRGNSKIHIAERGILIPFLSIHFYA